MAPRHGFSQILDGITSKLQITYHVHAYRLHYKNHVPPLCGTTMAQKHEFNILILIDAQNVKVRSCKIDHHITYHICGHGLYHKIQKSVASWHCQGTKTWIQGMAPQDFYVRSPRNHISYPWWKTASQKSWVYFFMVLSVEMNMICGLTVIFQ